LIGIGFAVSRFGLFFDAVVFRSCLHWNYAASLIQPIFDAGKLRANVQLSNAEDQQMVLTYRQTIQRRLEWVDWLRRFRCLRFAVDASRQLSRWAAHWAQKSCCGGSSNRRAIRFPGLHIVRRFACRHVFRIIKALCLFG
jgi:hypothetical protein